MTAVHCSHLVSQGRPSPPGRRRRQTEVASEARSESARTVAAPAKLSRASVLCQPNFNLMKSESESRAESRLSPSPGPPAAAPAVSSELSHRDGPRAEPQAGAAGAVGPCRRLGQLRGRHLAPQPPEVTANNSVRIGSPPRLRNHDDAGGTARYCYGPDLFRSRTRAAVPGRRRRPAWAAASAFWF